MAHCIHHPEREAGIQCMKHQVYLCRECLRCRDPKIYCKFRTACPIWFMQKASAKWGDDAGGREAPPRAAAGFE